MAFKRVLSVSDLNGYVKGVFDDELMLHNLTVFGEAEEMKTVGGITYLTLCDASSRLSCVMFSACEPFPKGVSVELDGGVRFHPKTGKVSFIIRDIRLRGEGERRIAFLKLKDCLEKEGVFDNKKPFPLRIVTVAVITSETGAVIHDFKSVLKTAGVEVEVAVFPVRVQGREAQADIQSATERVNQFDSADICVFMRGGGSEGDLEVFNSEAAARAVKSCKVFTISAVGHETDTTLCDLAADARAGTPSIAAEMICKRVLQTRAQVHTLGKSLIKAVERIIRRQNTRLGSAVERVGAKAEQKIALGFQKTKFLAGVAAKSMQSKEVAQTVKLRNRLAALQGTVLHRVALAEKALQTASYRLDAQSPLKLLAKGYARAEQDGAAVQKAAGLKVGDALDLYFEDGKVEACVERITLRKGDGHGV